jgi:hypothetical protein
MTLDEFRKTIAHPQPPSGLATPLLALWHDARGDWDAAHQVAQDVETSHGSWVHAYLHRKEGDLSNAAYWYRQAGRPVARADLDREWEEIAGELLQSGRL